MTAIEPAKTLSGVPETAPARRGASAGAVAAVLLLALAPFALDPASLNTLGRIIYFALLAASLDISPDEEQAGPAG